MMSRMLTWRLRWLPRSQVALVELERASRWVADASFAEAHRRLSPAIGNMTRSEFRGYVRARSRAVVTRHAAAALCVHGPLPGQVVGQVVEQALGHLTQQMLRWRIAGGVCKTPARAA